MLGTVAVLALLAAGSLAQAAELPFREQSLELPGSPAALVPADVDGDGWRDLVVAVVYTQWDQIGIEEWTEMDQVEGLVEVLTIVPTLLDRRELRVYRGTAEGTFELSGEPTPLPLEVLTLETGPPGLPVVALTDAGLSTLRLDGAGRPLLEPVLAAPPVLAGTGTFLAGLDLVRDVTGDGVEDLLLPAEDGLHLFRGRPAPAGGGLEATAAARVPYPEAPSLGGRSRDVPLPEVVDLDGDRRPDLLFRLPGKDLRAARVALQVAPGRFAPDVELAWPEGGEAVWVGIATEAGAVVAVADSLDDEDAGLRKEMRQVREPRNRLRLHPLGAAPGAGEPPAVAAEPSSRFESVGWVAGGLSGGDGGGLPLPGGFQDLNGDGRVDLVTVTNDLSVLKAMSVLATRRLSLDLGFLTWCQRSDGRFVRAPGGSLASKLTIRLNDLEIRQRSLFEGDFDGDGRRDFLQLGRSDGSREIGVHRGRSDCSYPERAEGSVRLRGRLRDLALAEVLDLDGDGRDDLAVIHPQAVDEAGVSPPVRLDLYVSRMGGGAAWAAGGAR